MDVRNIPTEISFAMVAAFNADRVARTRATSYPHASPTSTTDATNYKAPTNAALQVTAANASNLATLRTLARDLYDVGVIHFADGGEDAQAHDAADATNTWGTKPAADASLSDLQTWLNARKVSFNAHLIESGVHYSSDVTNTVSTADAADQSTANALANAIKDALNAHITLALPGFSVRIVGA